MSSKLRVLVIEDSEDDALLMLRELRKGGYELDYDRVDTEAATMNALQSREWDVIICDYNMPAFRGDHALSLLKESGLDVPFILLSGTIGEEIAVDMMKVGAHDYIMKDNLARLVPAIQRELREAKIRQEGREAEVALRESEEWFRAIYEESPIAINVFDADGNLIHANPACVDFAGVSSVEDLKVFNMFEDPNLSDEIKQRIRTGERVLYHSVVDFSKVKEARLYDTSRSGVRHIEAGASPLRYGTDKSLHGYLVQIVDITERVLAEANTKAAAETAMLYLDLMGHDIRNHLQAIIMGTEILEQLDIRPEVREMVDLVVDSVEHSRNLIKKVQSTRGLLSVPLSSTLLREALEDCLQVLNETYDDVQIEVNLDAQQPTVFADKYLENLLMNILENAILHNDKKTRRVWVDLREAKGGYEVVIADNGSGIDNDKKESLFDQSRRFGGVGVHQAFRIAQKYGGHITVQDRVPSDSNKGAEFHIWFPKSTA